MSDETWTEVCEWLGALCAFVLLPLALVLSLSGDGRLWWCAVAVVAVQCLIAGFMIGYETLREWSKGLRRRQGRVE